MYNRGLWHWVFLWVLKFWRYNMKSLDYWLQIQSNNWFMFYVFQTQMKYNCCLIFSVSPCYFCFNLSPQPSQYVLQDTGVIPPKTMWKSQTLSRSKILSLTGFQIMIKRWINSCNYYSLYFINCSGLILSEMVHQIRVSKQNIKVRFIDLFTPHAIAFFRMPI